MERSESLDAAWAEAESALPDGWRIIELSSGAIDVNDPSQAGHPRWWFAYATPLPDGELPGIEGLHPGGPDADYGLHRCGSGATPAAALYRLAEELRVPWQLMAANMAASPDRSRTN